MCICMYVCMYVCMYTYIYIYIYSLLPTPGSYLTSVIIDACVCYNITDASRIMSPLSTGTKRPNPQIASRYEANPTLKWLNCRKPIISCMFETCLGNFHGFGPVARRASSQILDNCVVSGRCMLMFIFMVRCLYVISCIACIAHRNIEQLV